MNAKLPAPLQEKVPPYPVKGLLEVHKHNIQPLPAVLSRVDQVLQGEYSIQCAMARPKTTLCGGTQVQLIIVMQLIIVCAVGYVPLE
jgi:hypothetical protein